MHTKLGCKSSCCCAVLLAVVHLHLQVGLLLCHTAGCTVVGWLYIYKWSCCCVVLLVLQDVHLVVVPCCWMLTVVHLQVELLLLCLAAVLMALQDVQVVVVPCCWLYFVLCLSCYVFCKCEWFGLFWHKNLLNLNFDRDQAANGGRVPQCKMCLLSLIYGWCMLSIPSQLECTHHWIGIQMHHKCTTKSDIWLMHA